MIGQRLINDHFFVCSSLSGSLIESFFGYYSGELKNGIDIVVLKVKGNNLYQRFFLDAGLGFWEEWSLEEATQDYEEHERIDLSSKYGVLGKRVSSIECSGSYEKLSAIVFNIENVSLALEYTDTNDLESETELHQL